MNVLINGEVKKKLTKMVKKGYGNTKSEAIRLAIISFNPHNFSDLDEGELVNKKLNKIDLDVKQDRKNNLLTTNKALGKYSKYMVGKNSR